MLHELQQRAGRIGWSSETFLFSCVGQQQSSFLIVKPLLFKVLKIHAAIWMFLRWWAKEHGHYFLLTCTSVHRYAILQLLTTYSYSILPCKRYTHKIIKIFFIEKTVQRNIAYIINKFYTFISHGKSVLICRVTILSFIIFCIFYFFLHVYIKAIYVNYINWILVFLLQFSF